MKTLPRVLTVSLVTVLVATGVFAQGKRLGPPGGTIYAHNEMYQTIGTPADLPNQGNFDTIYVLGQPYANVADAAPGDQAFNGGRWEVRIVEFLTIAPMQFTNADDIKMAEMQGTISIGPVVKRFECPMIQKH